MKVDKLFEEILKRIPKETAYDVDIEIKLESCTVFVKKEHGNIPTVRIVSENEIFG